MYHYEKKYQAFFNILTEPLLVQKLMIHQQKAHDLSYLEPEGQGRGIIMGVTRLLLLGPFYTIKMQFYVLFCTRLYDMVCNDFSLKKFLYRTHAFS